MELSVGERLGLFVVLPKEGSFDTLRLVRELREQLALTEEEVKQINYRQESTPEPRWVWDTNFVKPFSFSEGARTLFRQGLELLNTKGVAQEVHLLLYERLFGNGRPATAEATPDAGRQ